MENTVHAEDPCSIDDIYHCTFCPLSRTQSHSNPLDNHGLGISPALTHLSSKAERYSCAFVRLGGAAYDT